MSSRFVRASKYRHIYGQPFKKEACYEGLRPTRNAWDSNQIAASSEYFGLCWDAGGGGSFAVIPHSATGRQATRPLFRGHTQAVIDLDFNPFNPSMIASGSEDCYVKVWQVPENQTEDVTEALVTLEGHQKKVGNVLFNKVANNVLATASVDGVVKTWDVEAGDDKHSIDTGALVQSIDWSYDGSLIAASCKDKKVRMIDPRTEKIVSEAASLTGVKGSRVCWLGNKDKLFVVGFTRNAERAFIILDPRNLETRLVEQPIDNGSGYMMPFYDNDTGVMYLAGKGDGNVRYYEMVDEAPYNYMLTQYGSNEPQQGMCMMPKRALNVKDCEVMRSLKVTNKGSVVPVSWIVPRKSDQFQADIFPPMFSGEPALQSDAWFGGENAEPKTVDSKAVFDGTAGAGGAAAAFTKKKSTSEQLKEALAEIEQLKARIKELEAAN